jgi:hypothetical protein
LEQGASTAVAHIPNFETNALALIASDGAGEIEVITLSGQTYTVIPQQVDDDLWLAALPGGSAVLESIAITAVSSSWQIKALTLVNENEAAFQPLTLGNYRLIHSGDVKIYENLDVLPRAFMVYEWLYRPSVAVGALAMGASGEGVEFDPRQQAVIVADGPERILGQGEGRVDVLVYEPERIELVVNTTDSGLLVLTEANYPGWQATIDGGSAEIQQTNGLFQGLIVSAGQHEVVFTFQPLTYQIGLIISFVSLAVFLFVLIVSKKFTE